MGTVKRVFRLVVAFGAAAFFALGCGSSVRHESGAKSTGGTGAVSGGGTGGASGGSTGGAAGSPEGVAAFCPRWLDEFARFMERCACDPATVARYRDANAVLCDPDGYFGQLVAAVAAGDLVYNSFAADELFARLRDPDALCVDEPFRALALDSVEVHSLAGVFGGTHRLGQGCTMPVGEKGGVSDCREGVCLSDGALGGICDNYSGAGNPCDLDANPGRSVSVCHETRPPDIDGEYASAFRTLVCVPASGASSGVCARDLEDGTLCRSEPACASHFCRNTDVGYVCAPKSANGEPCQSHAECASGACGLDDVRVCGEPLPDGAMCEYSNDACASGFCNDLLGNNACGPAPSRAIGEACGASSDCISLGSGNSRDRACQAGRCVNDICAEYSP